MRSRSGELRRLSLHGLIVPSSQIIYWGLFLRSNYFHLVSVLHEFQIHSGSYGVLLVHLSSVLLKDFRLVILPIRSDWTVDCTRPGADCKLVSLVSIIFKVFYTRWWWREVFTVPGTNGGQTHLGSLEGKSTITVWKLAPRRKFIKQAANITIPPTHILAPSQFDHAMLDFITN